jgi:hypothetical protein
VNCKLTSSSSFEWLRKHLVPCHNPVNFFSEFRIRKCLTQVSSYRCTTNIWSLENCCTFVYFAILWASWLRVVGMCVCVGWRMVGWGVQDKGGKEALDDWSRVSAVCVSLVNQGCILISMSTHPLVVQSRKTGRFSMLLFLLLLFFNYLLAESGMSLRSKITRRRATHTEKRWVSFSTNFNRCRSRPLQKHRSRVTEGTSVVCGGWGGLGNHRKTLCLKWTLVFYYYLFVYFNSKFF